MKEFAHRDCTVIVCSCDKYADLLAPFSAVYYGLIALRNHRPDIAGAYLKGTVAGIFETP